MPIKYDIIKTEEEPPLPRHRLLHLGYNEFKELRKQIGLRSNEKLYASYLRKVGKDYAFNLSIFGLSENHVIVYGDRMEFNIAMFEFLTDSILVAQSLRELLE